MNSKWRIACPKCGERAVEDVYISSERTRDGTSEEECGFNDGDLIISYECGFLGRIDDIMQEIEQFGACMRAKQ